MIKQNPKSTSILLTYLELPSDFIFSERSKLFQFSGIDFHGTLSEMLQFSVIALILSKCQHLLIHGLNSYLYLYQRPFATVSESLTAKALFYI